MIASADRRHTLASCDLEETLCTNTEAIFTQDISNIMMWEIITFDFSDRRLFSRPTPGHKIPGPLLEALP